MSEIKIEELNINDWDQYIKLKFQLDNYTNIMNFDIFKKKYQLIKEQNSFIYVIKYNDKIITSGKLLIEFKIFENVAHIEDIIVDKDYRNNGYGKMLVNYIINEASKYNCYKIILDCYKHLEPFYEKCGLKSNNTISMSKYYKNS